MDVFFFPAWCLLLKMACPVHLWLTLPTFPTTPLPDANRQVIYRQSSREHFLHRNLWLWAHHGHDPQLTGGASELARRRPHPGPHPSPQSHHHHYRPPEIFSTFCLAVTGPQGPLRMAGAGIPRVFPQQMVLHTQARFNLAERPL